MPISKKEFAHHSIHDAITKLEEDAKVFIQHISDGDAKFKIFISPYRDSLNTLPLKLISVENLNELEAYILEIIKKVDNYYRNSYNRNHQNSFDLIGENFPQYSYRLQLIQQAAITKRMDEVVESAEKFESEISKFVVKAKESDEKIKNLEYEESEETVAETYYGEAKKQARMAKIWIIAAVFCLISALLNAVLVIYYFAPSGVSQLLIQISPISLFLLTGAGISSAFSKFHRNNEKEAQRIALDMAAINPFIAPLGNSEKSEVIKYLALKYFAHTESRELAQSDSPLLQKAIDKVGNSGTN